MIKFPKIYRHKQASKALKYHSLSSLKYHASVKIHGTNAAVGKTEDGQVWFQSRNRVITPDDDNQGFAKWAVRKDWDFLNPGTIIYGEWAGEGIQAKVAISNAPRTFFIFSTYDHKYDEWVPLDFHGDYRQWDKDIIQMRYHITNIEIDFKDKECMEFIKQKTLEVEDQCPVAKRFFDIEGIGEGLVWQPADYDHMQNKDFWFKSKGVKHQKHAKASSYKPAPDYSKAQKWVQSEFEKRAYQGVEYIKEMHGEATRKQTGDFIKWCAKDILQEEELPEGVSQHDVGKVIGSIASSWYLEEV